MMSIRSRTLLRQSCSSFRHAATRRWCSRWNKSLINFRQPILLYSTTAVLDNESDDLHETNTSALGVKSRTWSRNGRLWMGPELSLTEKVKRFLEVPPGDLARLDIHLLGNDLIVESCKLETLHGLQQAEDVLHRLLMEKRTKKNLMISLDPFQSLIFGWARTVDARAPEKMIELLHLLKKEFQYDLDHFEAADSDRETPSKASCAPNTALYNTILLGLARASKNNVKAALIADDIVDEMCRNYTQREWLTNPNSKTYTHLLQAHGNTCLPEAADRVERILLRVKDIHEKGKKRYFAKFGTEYNTADPDQNVHRIVTPDPWLYTVAMDAIIKSNAPNYAERASAVLVDQLESGNKVSAAAFNTIIHALAKQSKSFTSPSRRFQSALRAEELAYFFEQFANTYVQYGMKANSPERQATVAFNCALNGWANAAVQESASRAEAIFKHLLESPSLNPDSVSLNTTLKALSRAQPCNPVQMEDLLKSINSRIEKGEHTLKCKPDSISYSTVMNAWSISDQPNKTQETQRILSDILARYKAGDHTMKPNLVAFTSVLKAAASIKKVDGDDDDAIVGADANDTIEEAYRIAVHLYDAVMTDAFNLDIRPDSLFFTTMLSVIEKHTDPTSVERRQMVQKVFDNACDAGLVSSSVIVALRKASPDSDLLARLLRDSALVKFLPSVDKLPPDWIRHVPYHPQSRDVDRVTSILRRGSSRQFPHRAVIKT